MWCEEFSVGGSDSVGLQVVGNPDPSGTSELEQPLSHVIVRGQCWIVMELLHNTLQYTAQ